MQRFVTAHIGLCLLGLGIVSCAPNDGEGVILGADEGRADQAWGKEIRWNVTSEQRPSFSEGQPSTQVSGSAVAKTAEDGGVEVSGTRFLVHPLGDTMSVAVHESGWTSISSSLRFILFVREIKGGQPGEWQVVNLQVNDPMAPSGQAYLNTFRTIAVINPSDRPLGAIACSASYGERNDLGDVRTVTRTYSVNVDFRDFSSDHTPHPDLEYGVFVVPTSTIGSLDGTYSYTVDICGAGTCQGS
jgi:hypothetical protein